MSPDAPKKVGGEYGSIRANIDVVTLESYLVKHLKGFRSPLDVKQFKFGQSNPTYFLTDANKKRYVLRKKPAGELLSKTAHQVEREYAMLHALHKYNTSPSTSPNQRVPVPEPYLLCEDKSVIGTPFYVMEFLNGRIFEDPRLPKLSRKDREECWLAAIHALTALSNVDPVAIGLSDFGPSSDYFPRQIKAFSKIAEVQRVAVDVDTKEPVQQVPCYDELIRWYKGHLPDESRLGRRIVHGDYKMDNLVFHPRENRVIGILDWELCTLGSPLADFVNLTQPWSVDPKNLPDVEEGRVTLGFKNTTQDVPASIEVMEREYCRRMKIPYPINDIVFVRSWMLFRGSLILQGIAARAARRQASSANAAHYAKNVELLGNLARYVLEDVGSGSQSKL